MNRVKIYQHWVFNIIFLCILKYAKFFKCWKSFLFCLLWNDLNSTSIYSQRRWWHPTPVLLPGNSHGQRSWWAAVHGVSKSQTRLSDFPFTFHFHALEKEMATHSSVLAWRIPGTEDPSRLPSVGSHRDWSDLAAAAVSTTFGRISLKHLNLIPFQALDLWLFFYNMYGN